MTLYILYFLSYLLAALLSCLVGWLLSLLLKFILPKKLGVRVIIIIVAVTLVLLALLALINVAIKKWGPVNPTSHPMPSVTQPQNLPTNTFTSTITPSPSLKATLPPTFTPTFTSTSTSTFTSTFTPDVFRGLDRGCIDAEYWQPISGTIDTIRGTGCWEFPVTYGFFARDGGLLIAPAFRSETLFYGVSTSIPDLVKIHLKIRFSELNNAQVWVGIFQEGWFDNSRSGLFFSQSSSDSITTQLMINGNLYESYKGKIALEQVQDIVFDFRMPLLDIYIDNRLINKTQIKLYYDKPVFWIGSNYLISSSGQVQSFVSDLTFK